MNLRKSKVRTGKKVGTKVVSNRKVAVANRKKLKVRKSRKNKTEVLGTGRGKSQLSDRLE